MDLKGIVPAVLYDDRCYLCIKFAEAVGRLGRNRISLVGHYSPLGEQVRAEHLESDALDMFWFIDGSMAYGGRAALGPLLRALLSSEPRGVDQRASESCDAGCKTAKAVFIRSASLLSNSRRIRLET